PVISLDRLPLECIHNPLVHVSLLAERQKHDASYIRRDQDNRQQSAKRSATDETTGRNDSNTDNCSDVGVAAPPICSVVTHPSLVSCAIHGKSLAFRVTVEPRCRGVNGDLHGVCMAD